MAKMFDISFSKVWGFTKKISSKVFGLLGAKLQRYLKSNSMTQ